LLDGKSNILYTLKFPTWPLTISQFPVSKYRFYVDLQLNILLCFNLAMSVEVEQMFSHDHLILSHVQSSLLSLSTHMLLCLGYWSQLDFIKADDLERVVKLPEIMDDKGVLDNVFDI